MVASLVGFEIFDAAFMLNLLQLFRENLSKLNNHFADNQLKGIKCRQNENFPSGQSYRRHPSFYLPPRYVWTCEGFIKRWLFNKYRISGIRYVFVFIILIWTRAYLMMYQVVGLSLGILRP